jgi:hypothetical protein
MSVVEGTGAGVGMWAGDAQRESDAAAVCCVVGKKGLPADR